MNTSLHLRPKRKTQTPSGLLSLNKHPRLCRGVAADAKPAGTSAFPGRHGSPPTVSTLKPSAGSARHVRPTVAIAEGGPAASPRWTPRLVRHCVASSSRPATQGRATPARSGRGAPRAGLGGGVSVAPSRAPPPGMPAAPPAPSSSCRRGGQRSDSCHSLSPCLRPRSPARPAASAPRLPAGAVPRQARPRAPGGHSVGQRQEPPSREPGVCLPAGTPARLCAWHHHQSHPEGPGPVDSVRSDPRARCLCRTWTWGEVQRGAAGRARMPPPPPHSSVEQRPPLDFRAPPRTDAEAVPNLGHRGTPKVKGRLSYPVFMKKMVVFIFSLLKGRNRFLTLEPSPQPGRPGTRCARCWPDRLHCTTFAEGWKLARILRPSCGFSPSILRLALLAGPRHCTPV